MRVVFDTNVYVSAFLVPGGQGEKAFVHAHRKRCALYTSIPILTETANVLRSKFHQEERDIKAVLTMIARAARIVRPSPTISLLQDTADNRILECAKEAEADIIVTGDRHILKLRTFESTAVIRLADFLRMFAEGR
ncbi:MAG: putative toxin-antitoxin system toxin component, PIN family [Nitrospirales bacterium]